VHSSSVGVSTPALAGNSNETLTKPSERFFANGREELDDPLLNGQLDPLVDERPEPFVGGQPLFYRLSAIGTDKPANGLAAVDIGQLAVRAVTLRVLGMHAAARRIAAHLVLARDTSGMHGA